jgi:hypothetical protein
MAKKLKHRALSLYELFLSNSRQDIDKWHHYFAIYERFLAPHRDRPVSLLEIGVYRGGSLRMWRRYLGDAARIYGLDIDGAAAQHAKPGTEVFIGDQADRQFLRDLKARIGPLDIVIDDGGHTAAQQITAFEELYPSTRQLYIVEDTHTSYWPRYMDMGVTTFLGFAKGKLDDLHGWHRDPLSFQLHGIPPDRRPEMPVSEFCRTTLGVHFFDSIVVFEKGENPPRWREVR